jgi:TetR/AcrR family transcriptional regulator, transcriptional repressor for nem operon
MSQPTQAVQNTSQGKAGNARERLLALAEAAVLEKGFAATSIDELIAGAGITKSGFFYHFKDKSELAKALMQRYIAEHDGILADVFRRADQLNDDPLHGFLVALRLLAEIMADLPSAHPGCLVASFVYQDQLLSREVREVTVAGVVGWQRMFRERLAAIALRYPPRLAVDLDDLADMANALVDGGIILSRLMRNKDALPRQILLYRELVRAVFLGC